MQNSKSNISWVIFIGLALIWGSSFILMKRGLESFHFWEVGALRLSIAFWFTLIIGFRKLKKLKWADRKGILIVGILGNGLPYMLFPIAISEIDSSVVGVINSMVPLFTLLVGFVFFKLGVKRLQVFGIVLGFVGATILINPFQASLGSHWYYIFFALLASLCYALSINTISNQLSHLDSMSITLFSLLIVGIPATAYLVYGGVLNDVWQSTTDLTNLGYIVILAVAGTSIAVILFNYLIKISSPIFSASVTYFIPIVALAWGWWDGENIGITTFLGIASILGGVYLVNKARA